jgi:hypothetical protein
MAHGAADAKWDEGRQCKHDHQLRFLEQVFSLAEAVCQQISFLFFLYALPSVSPY